MHFPTILVVKLIYWLTLLSVTKGQEQCTTPSFEDGFCVPYSDCPFVTKVYAKYGAEIPQHFKNYIFKSKCSRDGEPTIRLCCTTDGMKNQNNDTDGMDNRYNNDLDKNKDFLSQLNPKGYDILNKLSCGASDGNRVAGGNETDLAEFPWMALLRFEVISGDEYLCGGALITNRFVLTAHHCVDKQVTPVIGVRLGEHDLLKNEDCVKKGKFQQCNPPVEDFGIETFIKHPKYRESRRINDIALIKLDRDVEFKRHIGPVCLPITPDSMQMAGLQDGLLIAGWGTTEKGSQSNVLLKARVNQLEGAVCEAAYRIAINEKHLCAGDLETGRDTCRGDSGGPLLLFTKYKKVKRYIQYGVVSAGGFACSLDNPLPGVYTNIINFLPWITNEIATA